jgi:hypothetical protein
MGYLSRDGISGAWCTAWPEPRGSSRAHTGYAAPLMHMAHGALEEAIPARRTIGHLHRAGSHLPSFITRGTTFNYTNARVRIQQTLPAKHHNGVHPSLRRHPASIRVHLENTRQDQQSCIHCSQTASFTAYEATAEGQPHLAIRHMPLISSCLASPRHSQRPPARSRAAHTIRAARSSAENTFVQPPTPPSLGRNRKPTHPINPQPLKPPSLDPATKKRTESGQK